MRTFSLLTTGGLGLLVLGLAVQLPHNRGAANVSQYSTAKSIPVAFLAVTLALFAVIILRDALAAWRGGTRDPHELHLSEIFSGRRMLFLIASVLYVFLFQILGFVLASLLYMAGTAFLLGAWNAKSFVISVLVAVVLTGLIYLVISYGLGSFLPGLNLLS